MSDDGDRFSAFDAVDGNDSATDDAEPEPESDPDPTPDPAPDPEPEPDSEIDDDTDDSALEDPAFSYAESNQGPIYARPETWNSYDDALELDVERYLRKKGVRNAQKRELHDAALRLAAKRPEELAELLIDARRES